MNCPCLTSENELVLYGKEPVFVYDREIGSNRPVPGIHDNVIRFWKEFPMFIKDKFCEAFSQQTINVNDLNAARSKRIMDNEWRNAFISLRGCLVKCPKCGEEMFLEYDKESICPNCGGAIERKPVLSFLKGKYRIPAYRDVEVFKCMTDDISDDNASVVGRVSVNPQNADMWGLKNEDSKAWEILTKDGRSKMLEPGRSYPFSSINEVRFGRDMSMKIEN